ncbi:heme exporter protein CcmD [Muricoccus radiodurans]
MSMHLIHVTAAWGLTAIGFGGLAIGAAWRHRAAARRLRELERSR